ncbi:hypothetical protein [Chryseobacterium sp. JK1]|uniref:hypothetical protein n=1 Tax=Chryseobacterium sp. JK1 TaxID=874294 RepID=UPI003D69265E
MKKIIFVFFTLSIIQCNGQKKDTITFKNQSYMHQPTIDSQTEKLDIEKFQKEGLKIINSDLKKTGYKEYEYRKDDTKRNINIQGNSQTIIKYRETFTNSIYQIVKIYYGENLIIKSKYLYGTIAPSILLGKECQYNQKGELTKTINHDLGWDFSYAKVVGFIGKHYNINPLESQIKIKKGERETLVSYNEDTKQSVYTMKPYYETYNTFYSIEKEENKKGLKYWKIKIKTDFKTDKNTFDILKLDALSGEILSYIEYENNYKESNSNTTAMVIIPKEVKIIVPDRTKK